MSILYYSYSIRSVAFAFEILSISPKRIVNHSEKWIMWTIATHENIEIATGTSKEYKKKVERSKKSDFTWNLSNKSLH